MTSISTFIKNTTSNDYIVHVFDLFGGGRRDITGANPFNLGKDETSRPFEVNAGDDGKGLIAYVVDGGPSLSNIDVRDGDTVELD